MPERERQKRQREERETERVFVCVCVCVCVCVLIGVHLDFGLRGSKQLFMYMKMFIQNIPVSEQTSTMLMIVFCYLITQYNGFVTCLGYT